ncbi:MAG TPA: cation diffusion facilitator family transporter [Mycobacteriales bacterium]|jgi:cation diffusion facilitator family transporter|nr:cation diffusion facilitator family transporter [Mycobacteriales bacterium]
MPSDAHPHEPHADHPDSGGHDHDHDHDDHGHADHGHADHGHGEHDHDHAHPAGPLARVKELFAPHSHDAADSVDSELEASSKGIRALIISFVALLVTTLLQAVVYVLSGSVALLGDTLHNAADALTAVPLAIAFTLGRRAANRRYTYGYGRAEDLAGLVVVLLITLSAVLAGYEAFRRLLDPADVDRLGLVAAAGVVGFLGNELVARYRIKVGREIGSAALVADGLHARTDGLTSLAVVVGAIGLALGFELADPIIGLVITVAILGVLRQAAREVFARLMDAVDPEVLDSVERSLAGTPGVVGVGDVKVRWIGHALRAECEVLVDETLSVVEGHAIAHAAEARLLRDVRRLTTSIVHAGPAAGQSRASTSR